MANLSAQIQELEEECYYNQQRVTELEEENTRLKDEVSDLEEQVGDLEAQLEWIHMTYPDLEVAYDAKQRLDQAT